MPFYFKKVQKILRLPKKNCILLLKSPGKYATLIVENSQKNK